MPHIVIKMYPGRSEEVKKNMAKRITDVIMETAGVEEYTVSVGIEETEKEKWMETVYKPEIEGKKDTLYKKPGY
jgi:4-oxalocrotonate tautomerase